MILVSIVGDFYSSILPVFYEFKDKIKTHIIVHDDYKNDELATQKIIRGTLSFIKENKLDIKSFIIKMDEDSFTASIKVNEMISKHVKSYKDLYINITDGLANVGVLISDEFKPKGANILTYDRYDNEYNILTNESLKSYKIDKSIPIKTHLQLKNIEVVATQDIGFAEQYEESLNLFFEKYEADRLLYKNEPKYKQALLEKPIGFLYEYYIYNLLKRLNYDDILLGVRVKDNRSDTIFLENEYDILMMKDNHLHMIECKYLKVLDTTALLYKLDSVRETLDEDANIIIVTDFDIYTEEDKIDTKRPLLPLKRGLAKRIYLRGSPRKCVETFMHDVDSIFMLESKSIKKTLENKKSFSSIKDKERDNMQREIRVFLQNKLSCDVDFFDPKEIDKLLQYKTSKKLSIATKDAMKDIKIVELLRYIRQMLQSTKEYLSMHEVYAFYVENIKRNV